MLSNQRIPDGACLTLHVSLPVARHPIVTRYYSPLEVDLAVVRWSTGQEFGLKFISMETTEWKRSGKHKLALG